MPEWRLFTGRGLVYLHCQALFWHSRALCETYRSTFTVFRELFDIVGFKTERTRPRQMPDFERSEMLKSLDQEWVTESSVI